MGWDGVYVCVGVSSQHSHGSFWITQTLGIIVALLGVP